MLISIQGGVLWDLSRFCVLFQALDPAFLYEKYSNQHMTTDPSFKANIAKAIFDEVKRQGLPFMMLLGGLYYLYTLNQANATQITGLQTEIKACNDQLIEYYKNDKAELTDVLNKNTKVLEETNELMIKLSGR